MIIRSLAVALTLILAATAGAQPASASNDDASLRDARTYAARFGVSTPEAVLRLTLQGEAGRLQAELESAYPDSYAGLWLEHQPFAVHVAFTSDAGVLLDRNVRGSALAGVAIAVEARYSLSQLRADLEALIPLARSTPAELSVNIPENKVDVFVTSRERLETASRGQGAEFPPTAKIRLTPSLSQPVANIYGGLAPTTCTLGFGVVNGSGTRGVTTAGHCSNSQSYAGANLPYQSGLYSGSHDEQWHTAPGFTVKNWVKDSVGTREINFVVARSSQGVGFFVCKYGRVTGYGCTTIEATDHLPQSQCVPNATSTFIRTVDDIVSTGDSGGPTYIQNEAYGQIICESPGFYTVYVASNYIESGLGVDILTSP